MKLSYTEKHSKDVRFSIRVTKQLFSKQSKFQQVDVMESKEFGRFLTLDGLMMVTQKDEFIYHDMIVHVAMATNPEIRRVLVIGGGDGGTVRELCRYKSIQHIDMVEIDKMVVEVSKKYLKQTACKLNDPRVHLYIADGLPFVRKKTDAYDLIIVDSTDPFGPGEGLFTKEFYGNCYNALRDDGIMVNQQGSPFYRHDAEAMQRSHKRIVSTFPISRVYQAHIPTYAAGYWLFGFASKKYHPVDDFDRDKWLGLHLKTQYYTVRLHVGAFCLPAFLEEMLKEVE